MILKVSEAKVEQHKNAFSNTPQLHTEIYLASVSALEENCEAFLCKGSTSDSPVAMRAFGEVSPTKQSSKPTQIEIWNTINQWSFIKFSNVKPPCTDVTPPLKSFWRWFLLSDSLCFHSYFLMIQNMAPRPCHLSQLYIPTNPDLLQNRKELRNCRLTISEEAKSQWLLFATSNAVLLGPIQVKLLQTLKQPSK